MDLPPLENPAFEPEHPPVDGRVPVVVARWGAASQLRWFARFFDALAPMPLSHWDLFYCVSAEHRGTCCPSCLQDRADGNFNLDECCCRALKEGG